MFHTAMAVKGLSSAAEKNIDTGSINLPEISNAWQINQTAIRQEQVSTWFSGMVSNLQIQGSKSNVQHPTAVTPGASSWGYWLHLIY